MKVSLSWLQEYVTCTLDPADAARRLTAAGLTVERVESSGETAVLDIEITSNRSDWLSYIGISREVAALYGAAVQVPDIAPAGAQGSPLRIHIAEPRLCRRYSGRVIENVRVGAAPSWLAARLNSVGCRAISNAVDITNYCMYETGQPLHVFDYDNVAGGTIVVRYARAGEVIQTLDNRMRELEPSMLIIADAEKPLAIAGIMGGTAAEVTAATRTVLLESAWFDPVSVRRTVRRLGLSTDSSYRFERGVDCAAIAAASRRAMFLFTQCLPGCRDAGMVEEQSQPLPAARIIAMPRADVSRLTGVAVPDSDMDRIVRALGFECLPADSGRMRLVVPGWRPDVTGSADIIEEIIRIWGYDTVPAQLPPVTLSRSSASDETFARKQELRRLLTGAGFTEVITYTLVSRKMLAAAAVFDEQTTPRITNPLSSEQEYVRPELFVSLLRVAAHNIRHGATSLAVFEIGKRYRRTASGYEEEEMLCALFAGDHHVNWLDRRRGYGFYDAKGIIEYIVSAAGLNAGCWQAVARPFFVPGQAAALVIADRPAALCGALTPAVLTGADCSLPVYVAEISLAALAVEKPRRRFTPLPKYPAVVRDLSFVVGRHISAAALTATIRAAAGPLLVDSTIFDMFEGGVVPADKRAIGFSLLFRSEEETLTEEQVNPLQDAVITAVAQRFGATLR